MQDIFFELRQYNPKALEKVNPGDEVLLFKTPTSGIQVVGKKNGRGLLGSAGVDMLSTISNFIATAKNYGYIMQCIVKSKEIGQPVLIQCRTMGKNEYYRYNLLKDDEKETPSQLVPMTMPSKKLLIFTYYICVEDYTGEEVEKLLVQAEKKYNGLFSDYIRREYEIVNIVMPTKGDSRVELMYSSETPKEIIPSIDEFFKQNVLKSNINLLDIEDNDKTTKIES